MTTLAILPHEIKALILHAAIDTIIKTGVIETGYIPTADTIELGDESVSPHRRVRINRAWKRITALLDDMPDMTEEAARVTRKLSQIYREDLGRKEQSILRQAMSRWMRRWTAEEKYERDCIHEQWALADALAMMALLYSSRASKKLAA